MQLFAVLFVVQIITASLLLSASSNTHSIAAIRHTVKQVLGTSLIAQDTTSDQQPSDQSTSTPTDQSPQPTSTPAPAESTPTAPTETASPTTSETQPSVTEVQPTTSQTQPTTQESPTILTPSESSSQGETPTVSPTPEVTIVPTETVNPAVANPEDSINNTDSIAPSLIDAAKKEDDSLATIPEDNKPNALVTLADNNLKKINDSLTTDNLASTAFLTQRLDDNLLQAQTVLANSQSPNIQAMKQTLRNFCQQASPQLQTQQLQVPEDLEQDVEIARGTCITLQQ